MALEQETISVTIAGLDYEVNVPLGAASRTREAARRVNAAFEEQNRRQSVSGADAMRRRIDALVMISLASELRAMDLEQGARLSFEQLERLRRLQGQISEFLTLKDLG